MAPDRATTLFYELHSGLPRQGPGTAASTRRALALVPDIGPRTRVLDIGCGTGAQTVGHFPLPASAWWDDYYRPLQDNVTAFRKRHHDAPDAQELAEQSQREIDIWHACSEFYGYEFCVLRAR